ncbi:MAG TPA: kelch repeat-containing protein [Xanthobacteraceae bacterium]|nr:kelch repeat-containing protein [Xanthobacteraceae bacterium]
MSSTPNGASWTVVATALVALVMPATHLLAQAPAPTAPTAANPWVNLAPFPNPSEEVLGATANGKLYVFAGLAPGWKPKAMVQEFDPAANAWSQKKPMPLASHHVAFASLNDKIYAFGGFKLPDSGPAAWEPIANAWEYDPAADSWKELAPMPTKRGAAAATALNGKLYVIGGATMMPGSNETGIHPARRHMVVGAVEEYDPASNTWAARSALPTPRNHHVVAAAGGRIWVIGGRIGAAFITSGSNTDVVEGYDPAADTWTPPRDRMPTARSAITYGVYKDKVIVAGGEFQDRRMLGAFRAVEAYDPAVNRWSILPSMPNPRHGLAGGVIGDRFYAVSGDAQSASSGAHTDVPFNQALQLDLVIK